MQYAVSDQVGEGGSSTVGGCGFQVGALSQPATVVHRIGERPSQRFVPDVHQGLHVPLVGLRHVSAGG